MKSFKLVTISALTLSLLAGPVVLAADGASEGKPAEYGTEGKIVFEESTEPVNPVDPLDPTKPVDPVNPIDPEKPVTPGTGGPLSLDYASSFNFGTQQIIAEDKNYAANVQVVKDQTDDKTESNRPLYAQVTDNRGGAQGWTLSVKQTSQFMTEGKVELEGAEIIFNNGAVSTMADKNQAVAVAGKIVLPVNGETTKVMSAKAGQGAGTSVYRLGDEAQMAEAVQLHVPGKTTKNKEAYTTSLTWVLSTVPEA